jgi:hypothetical protein
MSVKAAHILDKSTWLRGPWVEEPDIIEWVDEASRLPCLILRNPEMGNLCGYVGVPPDHPAWGHDYSGEDEVGDCLDHARVHGGLTYAGVRPDSVEDGLWWYGFDCAHYGDSTGFSAPVAAVMKGLLVGVYRDVTYVMDECADLAKFLGSMK